MTVNLPHAAQAKAESSNKRGPKRLVNYEEEMTESTFNATVTAEQTRSREPSEHTPLKIPNLHI